MAKRGRKPNPNKTKNYFGDLQEQAVRDYMTTTSLEEKNYIYRAILMPAFNKLVESIIRRYKLYIPDETFDETFADTLSFLITKMEKFNFDKNKKAYSYFGTICKNYLYGRIEDYNKQLEKKRPIDYIEGENTDVFKYSMSVDKGSKIASTVVSTLIDKYNYMLENPTKYALRENEIKLGNALVTLLDNWDYVLTTDASNKLNKNAILMFLKENTGMSTNEIHSALRKYKKEFLLTKEKIVTL